MKQIRLFLAGLLVLMSSAVFAQDINITGTVTDESTGEVVPFASIQVKGTMTGTSTLDDGTYSITAPSDATLIFSFIGYKNLEVAVRGRKELNVSIAPDSEVLEETVVVGYGSARKVGTTVGSISKVSAKTLEARPQASAFESLQGQVPGLQIYTSSGDPGELQSIRLHGIGSITASSAPLYILDGVAVEATTIRSMNPNDIETMSVLKDASATSIYGSRAANGVIYVTSKRGRAGDSKITVRGQYGVSSLATWDFYDNMMSTEQLWGFWETSGIRSTNSLNLLKESLVNANMTQANGDFNNFEWTRYLQKNNRPIYQADISISGGSDRTTYYVSGSIYDETGTAPATFYSRYGFRSNIDSRVNSWFRLGANVQLAYDERATNGFYDTNNQYGGLSYLLQPYYSPYLADGSEPHQIPLLGMWNPYYLTDIQPQVTKGYNVNLSGYAEFEPIRNLKLRVVPGMDKRITNYDYKALPVGPFTGSGTSRQNFTHNSITSITNTLEYRFTVGQKHSFTALVGQEGISYGYNAFSGGSNGQTDPRLMHLNNGIQSTYSVSSTDTYSNFLSYFGRADYAYDNRLFFDVSVRNDSSSRFSPDHKSATFWAVGGMWNLKNESYFRSISWLDALNFKASYGTQGNAAISDYEYQSLIGSTSAYDSENGFGIASAGNSDLKWEIQSKLTIGLSARFYDRFTVSVEYYNRVTNDMLMDVPVASTTGFTTIRRNVGSLENNGVDLSVNVDLLRGRDYYLGVNANFNYNTEKITQLFDGKTRWQVPGTGVAYVVGKPVMHYWPIYAGVNPETGNQQWYLPEANIDNTQMDPNKVTEVYDEDKLTQNTGMRMYAPIAGGFSISGMWKGFGLQADFSYSVGKNLLSNDRFFTENPFAFRDQNQSANILDYWKEPGDNVEYPDWTKEPIMQFDTHLVENASFLRLKNLTVSYTLPNKYLRGSKSLKGAKIYFSGRNILTFKNKDFKGMDPEVDQNLTLGKVANTRQFQLGLEFTF